MNLSEQVNWDKINGLIPAVVQDTRSGSVLMLGYMNKESLALTETTKLVTFFSRTRNQIWRKGETSGHTLVVDSLELDCDKDTVLVKAVTNGPVCHEGTVTCFKTNGTHGLTTILDLERTIYQRRSASPQASYTAKLFAQGRDKISKKLGEEAVEVVIASKNDSDQEFLGECADLIYHLTVLLADRNLNWSDIEKILVQRATKKN
jgi:phosphoribosyl-ATP pyrophosphohydrolase/phosphoribosyl-AMP cyclohydrolase